MFIILLSWIYIFITSSLFGITFKSFFGIDKCHHSIHLILGLFLYTLLTIITAFFARIYWEYYLFVFALNLILGYLFRNQLLDFIKGIIEELSIFKKYHKLLFLIIVLITCAQSATKPYLLDNESYYIQTIKWINEYGFVKGLANLHPYLGQNSSWHALQAGFNFPFFTKRLNDINGFVFITMAFLFIGLLNKPKSRLSQTATGSVLLFTLFIMQFINAPSPDIIAFLVAPYILFFFLERFYVISKNDFKILLSLVLFLCLVKLTMILLVLAVFVLYIKNYSKLKQQTINYLVLSSFIAILFILKNIVISGYPLYPSTAFNIFDLDWKQPIELVDFYKDGTYKSGMNNTDTSGLNLMEKIIYWFNIPKLHGLFNKVYILLLIVFPIIILKRKNNFGLPIIYTLAILQLILVWFNSPQYRFFFPYIIVLSTLLLALKAKKSNLILSLIFISASISAIPLFLNIDLNHFTKNKFAMNLSTFSFKNILVPERNSKITTDFNRIRTEKFEYFSPNKDVFFWATGDGPLPCVNEKQIEYFRYYYQYLPQKRSSNLRDGFKSTKIKPN